MANICDTSLNIQNAKDDSDLSERSGEIMEFIKTKIAYSPDDVNENYCDEDLLEVYVGTRWNVPSEELQKLAKKFCVKVRAVGREDGNGFVQVVCIDEEGKIVQDEEIDYKF